MRIRFIADYQRDLFSFSELCGRYGISRKTGYKWVQRYMSEGPSGLQDRSHSTHSCPHSTAAEIADALLQLRKRHPSWGAKKLLAKLAERQPGWTLPARSTAHDLLRRHGLIDRKRRRQRRPHPGRPSTEADQPNRIWTADFKGHFRTGNGRYCYPLTLADAHSRFLLAVDGLTATTDALARGVFERSFREFGLPERIRSDNGVPFAAYTLGRLSRLSAWWIRLGIRPELIEPGKPQQNASHERMHRTLKAETTRPAAASLRAQQRRFDLFRCQFNEERPHEALNLRPPASLYQPSPRPYPRKLPPLDYPAHFEVRLVSRNGGIRWHNRWLNITTVLADEHVGFEEIDDGLWTLYYSTIELGRLDERTFKIVEPDGRANRTNQPRGAKRSHRRSNRVQRLLPEVL